MSLGLCVSPAYLPSQTQVVALDPPTLRSVLYVPEDLARLKALGRPLWLTVNNEFSAVRNWDGWEEAMRFIATNGRGQVLGVECGNELDIFWSRNRNDVPPGFAADLVNRAQPILSEAGIAVCTTSVAGPEWVTYLDNMLRYCSPDYVCLHPYGWVSAGLANKLDQLRAVSQGHKMRCSEVGVHLADAGGEDAQAQCLRSAASTMALYGVDGEWFAWHDAVGAPWERGDQAFGLMAEDGRKRPAWDTFASLGQAPAQPLVPALGWIGPGLQAELDRLGWTPTSGEHVSGAPIVWAQTDDGEDGVIVWDAAAGRAIPYRRSR